MTNEKEWWLEEPFCETYRVPQFDTGNRVTLNKTFHLEKIVTEATRKGEVKAWEEAKGMIEAEQRRIDSFHRNGYIFNVSIEIINARLTSLKKV